VGGIGAFLLVGGIGLVWLTSRPYDDTRERDRFMRALRKRFMKGERLQERGKAFESRAWQRWRRGTTAAIRRTFPECTDHWPSRDIRTVEHDLERLRSMIYNDRNALVKRRDAQAAISAGIASKEF
jgi:hypothetical protein